MVTSDFWPRTAPSALTHVAAQRILLIELVELIFDDIEISCRDHKSVAWRGGGGTRWGRPTESFRRVTTKYFQKEKKAGGEWSQGCRINLL